MFVSTGFFGKSFLLSESYKAPRENCHNEENQSWNIFSLNWKTTWWMKKCLIVVFKLLIKTKGVQCTVLVFSNQIFHTLNFKDSMTFSALNIKDACRGILYPFLRCCNKGIKSIFRWFIKIKTNFCFNFPVKPACNIKTKQKKIPPVCLADYWSAWQ